MKRCVILNGLKRISSLQADCNSFSMRSFLISIKTVTSSNKAISEISTQYISKIISQYLQFSSFFSHLYDYSVENSDLFTVGRTDNTLRLLRPKRSPIRIPTQEKRFPFFRGFLHVRNSYIKSCYNRVVSCCCGRISIGGRNCLYGILSV